MRDTVVSVRVFTLAWMVMALAVLLVVLNTEKLSLHAAINCCHTHGADLFFTHATKLADGLVPTALALALLLFRDLRSFLMMGLSAGLSAIVVQLLKHNVFPDSDRPFMFKEQLGVMDWVEGIDMNHYFSFPSGHSTAAFSMCIALAVVIGKRRWAVPLALCAALLAFSRVYLSQHFTEDVLAGSLLGTATGVAVHWWLYLSTFSRRAWLDKRILKAQNQ
ncbi:MAG: phosphatase PAP2 family protein [Flavobacteriales bacterium]